MHGYSIVEAQCPKHIETRKQCPPSIVSKEYLSVHIHLDTVYILFFG